ncbi:Na/Pi cotransporter family protein [Brucellaceae bacterium C25G]
MSGSVVLLNLAGAVALLLWATRMVRTGVEEAFGEQLRRGLRNRMQNPLLAVAFGTGLAIALQSSTAVTLLVGSFVGSGFVSGLAGLMAVRGGELGSALVVKILTFDLTLMVPLLLVAGTAISMSTERQQWRHIGRICVGIALLILSLEMTSHATEPLRDSELLPVIVDYLKNDPITAYLLAALMTWLFHSSVAAIILLTSFASRGLIDPNLAVVMVLGVNLGSSVIAPLLTRRASPENRIVPLGNLLMRGAGSLVILLIVETFKPDLSHLGSDPTSQVINAHILFNVIILIAGIPLSGVVLRTTKALVQINAHKYGPQSPAELEQYSALDTNALQHPAQALANATREVLSMCETVEVMLQRVIDVYEKPDQTRIDDLKALDDRVDKRHMAIKLYLTKLATQKLTETESSRIQELLEACIKLEQVGDIIVRNMLVHVQKKLDLKLDFTDEGWKEIAEFHNAVLTNAHLAFNVILSRDSNTARQLVQEKDRLRELERDTTRQHFSRLREGSPRSIETSTIHLDTIRDLKQVNSLLASLAYPVLEEEGQLGGTRLRKLPQAPAAENT